MKELIILTDTIKPETINWPYLLLNNGTSQMDQRVAQA